MSVYHKLLIARQEIGTVNKDKTMGGSGGGYKYASINEVSEAVRAALDTVGLAFFPAVEDVTLTDGRYLIKYLFTFVDADTGDTVSMAWAGEALASYTSKDGKLITDDKALGKAHTYAEKYFFLRLFIVSAVDDPDLDDHETPSRAANIPPVPNQNKGMVAKLSAKQMLDITKLGESMWGKEWHWGENGEASWLQKTIRAVFKNEALSDLDSLTPQMGDTLIDKLTARQAKMAQQVTPTDEEEETIPF